MQQTRPVQTPQCAAWAKQETRVASLSIELPTAQWRDKHALIYVGFVLAIVMLAVMAVVSYRSIGHFVERVDNVEKTQRIFLVNQEVLALLKDAVIAQRGFVITGEARYLAPSDAALANVQERLSQLRKLLGSGDGPSVQRLDAIERLGKGIIDVITESIVLKRRGVAAESPELVALIDAVKRDLDQVRALVRDIRTDANDTLLGQLHESQSNAQTVTRVLVLTELVSLAILILAFGLLMREVKLRSRAEQALRQANDELELRITARTAELADSNAHLEQEIAEHRRARSEIAALNLSLETRVAQRTEELEDAYEQMESFGYSVSHDLRAPLRAIMGFARMLESDHADKLDPQALEMLRTISGSTRKMGQLIDDLLAFSRISRAPMNSAFVDIRGLADKAMAAIELRPELNGMRCEVGAMPQARCDAPLLERVWSNLLSNAAKFSVARPDASIQAGGYQIGRELVYFVRDTGVGFDMRYYHKLFGVFERLHGEDEFPGTGVGLAIVKRIIVRHGGRVWAEGAPNQGATFFFTLPLIERHAHA